MSVGNPATDFCNEFESGSPDERIDLVSSLQGRANRLVPDRHLTLIRKAFLDFPLELGAQFERLLHSDPARQNKNIRKAFKERYERLTRKTRPKNSLEDLAAYLGQMRAREGQDFGDIFLDFLEKKNPATAIALRDIEQKVQAVKESPAPEQAYEESIKEYEHLHPEWLEAFLRRTRNDRDLEHLEAASQSLSGWTRKHLKSFEKQGASVQEQTLRLFHKIKHDTSLSGALQVLDLMLAEDFSPELKSILTKIKTATLKIKDKSESEKNRPTQAEERAGMEQVGLAEIIPDLEEKRRHTRSLLGGCVARSKEELQKIQAIQDTTRRIESIIEEWNSPDACNHRSLKELLDKSDPVFARIMALLTRLSQRLTIQELKSYINGLIERLQKNDELTGRSPHIIERLTCYRDSLKENAPESLKHIHAELYRLKQEHGARNCIAFQVEFLETSIEDPAYNSVRLTLLNILSNILNESSDFHYYATRPMEENRLALQSLMVASGPVMQERLRNSLKASYKLRPAEMKDLAGFAQVEEHLAPVSPWFTLQSIVKNTGALPWKQALTLLEDYRKSKSKGMLKKLQSLKLPAEFHAALKSPEALEKSIPVIASLCPPAMSVELLQNIARINLEQGQLPQNVRNSLHRAVQKIKKEMPASSLKNATAAPQNVPLETKSHAAHAESLDAMLDKALHDVKLEPLAPVDVIAEDSAKGLKLTHQNESFKTIFEAQGSADSPQSQKKKEVVQEDLPRTSWDEKLGASLGNLLQKFKSAPEESSKKTESEAEEKVVSIGKLALKAEKDFFPLTGKEKARQAFQYFCSQDNLIEKALNIPEINKQEQKMRQNAAEALARSIAVTVRVPEDVRLPGMADTLCFPRKAWSQEPRRKVLIKWCREMAAHETPGSARSLFYTWLGDEIEFKYYLSHYKRGKLD